MQEATNEKRASIFKIRSDHGKEFENARFDFFFFFFAKIMGLKRNFQLLRLLNKMGWLREKIG